MEQIRLSDQSSFHQAVLDTIDQSCCHQVSVIQVLKRLRMVTESGLDSETCLKLTKLKVDILLFSKDFRYWKRR